ncbi:large subunit ribosomal protein L18e [Methanomicrobium sp. W14]|jgi:large subunit ribosomal protein L18e|uniref:50S ribosomal protein L18e n=1 Tax=Methanomicrobium sp. W14 TaxID=2817839 RepID=UPI001AE2CAB3|nr:50S ribosomal protein L18e [Methanomicrobium sp. W14]MBP2132102.1 large subunit ribosomal protein L18e [Methanomicrobium sp. W14]
MKAAKTNPRYTALVTMLREASRANEAGIWREIAKRLEAPSKNFAEVNLGKINRYAREGETLIVPGKVLGSGILDTGVSVSVAALNFSDAAASKIKDAKGTCMTIEDLVKTNPEGKKIRILR